MKWIVVIAGGHGDKSWDKEFAVEAPNFSQAHEAAVARVVADPPACEWDFVSIVQDF